jgi:hypothetical protein
MLYILVDEARILIAQLAKVEREGIEGLLKIK